MYVIGLTGGIGSGKTAVSDRFAALGITIVDTDVVAREVVEPGTKALNEIARHFGEDILDADGSLDRAALRKIVFEQPEEKQWLESLLHPVIAEETIRQLEEAASPYAMLVSPLLVEMGQNALCQRTLVVDAPEELQISRTMTRDNNSRELVENIMASQAQREDRLRHADDVLINDGGLEKLDREVAQLHQSYLELAGEHAQA